ncbi:MAG: hypothetical protein HQ567_10220 [Candidatus Nealsonbacteria bacterium]|nr:hypothetical protein [Candidatus Nealsonbacteria bacterium]
MTRWIYHFDDQLPEGSDHRGLLGGKGAGLRQMKQAGLAVPPGFTISTQCCTEYFKFGRRWPEGLETELRSNLSRLESESGRRFGQGAKPLLVSVRSGAARSMPGMMDTLLNCGLHPDLADELDSPQRFWELYQRFIASYAKIVQGLDPSMLEHGPADRDATQRSLALYREQTGEPFPQSPWDALCGCINAVFDSWENPRAVAYRRRHDIRHLHGTAVNVQMMFPSQVSGIVFTHDPTAPQEQRIVIEAAYGLGESIVSGDVTPDRYLIPRDNLDNVTTRIGQKNAIVRALGDDKAGDPEASCLDREQLRELCQLCLDVEEHFGHPVDVEFGLADGRLALLQVRAIRGLDVALAIEPARRGEVARLQHIAEKHGRRKVWVAHNLGETLPSPTPLTWDIVGEFMRGDGGFGQMYRRLGYRPSQAVRDDGFLELICGRIYADPDRLADLFLEGMPLGYDADCLVQDPALLDQAPTKFVAERADGRFLLRVIPMMIAMFKSSRITRRIRATVADRFEQEVLPEFLRWIEAERSRELGALDGPDLLDLLGQRIDRTMHRFGPESLLPGFFGGIALAALRSRLEQLLGPAGGRTLADTLTRALDGDTTFEQDALLWKVGRGEARLEDVLARFGHRCQGEMELARPRWREDDALLVQTIERLAVAGVHDPHVMHRENTAKREAAETALPETLAPCGGSCFLETITEDLRQVRRLLPYRESGKFYLMMGYELIRNTIEELGRRWSLGRDIYFLRREELARFTANEEESRRIIDRRKVKWEALKRLEVGPVVDSKYLDRLGLAPELPSAIEQSATEHAATALAAGRASGPARLVFDPGEAGDLGTDYVLVCPSTDPGWTPLLIGAVALVVERGGVLSHGAIVARDFGIPAVVLPHATRLIEDGRTIRVDGDTARVSLLESGGPP